MSFTGRKQFNPLDKRIPENPRYKHVKPMVDSGASVNKYYERLEEMKRNYKFKKDEIFRRIKASTFVQLVLQIVSVGIDEGQLLGECPVHSRMEPRTPLQPRPSPPQPHPYLSPSQLHQSPPSTARSTLSDLVSGLGELDVSGSSPCSTPHQSPVSQPTLCPYLLLDVRETEQFDKCHIITARNYPARMLSRSVNPYTKELFEYRNKPDHIIIVYDEDESVAHDVATKLVQRDFDNVFMLSGGLKVLYKAFPRGIITGVRPQSCRPSPMLGPSSGRKKPVIDKAQPIIVITPEVRDYFTMDDLMCLQQTLDEVLLSSNASSRCGSSRSSSVSTRLSTAFSLQSGTQKTTWKY